MATTTELTITLPVQLVEGIDRVERDRNRFIAEAVAHELRRRDREGLADAGLEDWYASVSAEDVGLVDPSGGTAVRWIEGQGWIRRARATLTDIVAV